MTRPHLLLTNDDGIDSPFFATSINAFARFAELTIAVPAHEQSWKGKSMTRVGRVDATRTHVAGHPAYCITGTPADCVNIAIHNLMPTPPDLVVAGINVGVNAGLSLVLGSGTVGACLEANIAGIPGIALSQQLSHEVYRQWDVERGFAPATLTQLREVADAVLPVVWEELFVAASPRPITWNVNLPFALSAPKLVRSYLGHSFYQQVFHGDLDQGFVHRLEPFERDAQESADHGVLNAGHVSATLLDIRTFGTL